MKFFAATGAALFAALVSAQGDIGSLPQCGVSWHPKDGPSERTIDHFDSNTASPACLERPRSSAATSPTSTVCAVIKTSLTAFVTAPLSPALRMFRLRSSTLVNQFVQQLRPGALALPPSPSPPDLPLLSSAPGLIPVSSLESGSS